MTCTLVQWRSIESLYWLYFSFLLMSLVGISISFSANIYNSHFVVNPISKTSAPRNITPFRQTLFLIWFSPLLELKTSCIGVSNFQISSQCHIPLILFSPPFYIKVYLSQLDGDDKSVVFIMKYHQWSSNVTKNHQMSWKIIMLKWNIFDDLWWSPKIMKLNHQRSWKMFHFNMVIFGD